MSETAKRPSAAHMAATVLVTVYVGACIYMYFMFMGWTGGSVYESDLPAHISLAVDDGLIEWLRRNPEVARELRIRGGLD